MLDFKAAIAGCGAISSVHADALGKLGVTVVSVCDMDLSKTAKYFSKAYLGYKTMIDEGGFDVLHICLPHHLHAPAAIYAMEQGINVLCEKPMAIHISEGEAMIKASQDNKVTLGVVFQNRYNAGSRLIKKALDSGALGKIKSGWLKVTWSRGEQYYTDSSWRGKWATEGGGVLINQAIHTFDLINYFFGESPAYVDASIDNCVHPTIEVEDVVEGVMVYGEPEEVKVSFYANTFHHYDAPVKLKLLCENGRVTLKGDFAIIKYSNGKKDIYSTKDDANLPAGAKSYWGISHARQIKSFYDSLTKGDIPEVDGKEALKTQRLIHCIYESARLGKRVHLNPTTFS